jgi:hypothetical protein
MAANPNTLIADATGLQTQPNELTLPAGSLAVAKNMEITRDGIAEVARGFANFSSNLPAFTPQQLLVIGGVAYLNLDSGLWYYDTTSATWLRKKGSQGTTIFAGLWIENGVLYITGNFAVNAVNLTTGVRTVVAGRMGVTGNATGTGDTARFAEMQGIWGDGAGNLYVVDRGNAKVRKVTTAGVVTDIASIGGADLWGIWGDGTNLYVTDTSAGLRRVVIATGAATVTGASGTRGVWGDLSTGRLYTVDSLSGNGTIYTMTIGALVSSALLAGPVAGGSIASGLSGDGRGNLYFSTGQNVYSCNATTGVASASIVGGNLTGYTDGIGSAANVNPTFILWNGEALYMVEQSNSLLRKVYLSTAYAYTLSRNQLRGIGPSIDGVLSGPT